MALVELVSPREAPALVEEQVLERRWDLGSRPSVPGSGGVVRKARPGEDSIENLANHVRELQRQQYRHLWERDTHFIFMTIWAIIIAFAILANGWGVVTMGVRVGVSQRIRHGSIWVSVAVWLLLPTLEWVAPQLIAIVLPLYLD